MTRSEKITAILLLALAQGAWANDDPTLDCASNVPEVINPLKDYDMIASNMAKIQVSNAFGGHHLIYSFTAEPHAKDNALTLNARTGLLIVTAGSKDKFDVKVTATNVCGSISSTFDVIIDEEE